MLTTQRNGAKTEYILGHGEREIRRLMLQAAVLRPITDRLLRNAGIRQGMRILDLGCGAGDVSMLAAELVGPSGSVVGIDQNPDAIAVARARARMANLPQIDFEAVPTESYADPERFDLVIGRYILIHQNDPAELIRTAARFVRPGGVVAFHEIDVHDPQHRSLPHVSLWQQAGDWIQIAFREATPHGDAGSRLIEHFSRAGLPQPFMFCESPVGGGKDSPLYAWIANTVESVAPQLVRMRILNPDSIALERLEARLREAVGAACSQVVGPAQYCAWTRLTGGSARFVDES